MKFKNTCVYICVIIKFVTMRSGSQVVKILSYGHGGEGSNFIFDILLLRLKLIVLIWQEKIKNIYTHTSW